MSYFSHSQIWAVTKDGKLFLGGRTNRAQVVFERETIALIEQLQHIDTSNIATDLQSRMLQAD
jgi:cytochrome c biogenesis protein